LELTQFHLSTPGSEITATGNLAAASSLRFAFTTHNLKEWSPLLEAAYRSQQLPFAVHGWASFNGNASGKLSELSVNGNLEVYDFDTTLPATAEPRLGGSLGCALHQPAVLQQSFRRPQWLHHSESHHGAFDASAALTDTAFQANDSFTLHVDFRNADASELAQLAGVTQPFAGALNLTLNLSGTRGDPHGDGHLELRKGTAYGVAIPLLKTDLRLSGGELQFNNIETSIYNAPVPGAPPSACQTCLPCNRPVPTPTGRRTTFG